MWSASFAAPELAPIDSDRGRATPVLSRIGRLSGLLWQLGRIWLSATVVAERVDRERLFALRRHHAQRLLARLRIEVAVHGEVPAYDEPVLLVANHVSWLDPYALNTVSGARFVAKSEVEAWPVVGTSAKRFGTFFLARGSCRSAARVKDQLARALRGRDPVGAFPEATTTDGGEILRFYPAMFQAAIDARAMVQPVALRYRTADGRCTDAAAYVGDMTIADSLRRLLPEPRLVVDLVFCPPLYSRGRERKELATRARRNIADALGLSCGDQPAHPSQLYPLPRKAA